MDRVLDEEIHELTDKLKKLQKRSTVKDFEGRRNSRNFDKQVSVLQRRLEKIGGPSDGIYLREFEEMENVSLSFKRSSRFDDSVVASGKLNVSEKSNHHVLRYCFASQSIFRISYLFDCQCQDNVK